MLSRAPKIAVIVTKFIVLAVFILAIWPSTSALAKRRVALVIGNSDYSTLPSLPNALQDAKLIAHSLRKLNFEVNLLLNSSRVGLEAALHRFAQVSDGSDLALIFYAGHGLQIDGQNYLIPIDANFDNMSALDFENTSLSRAIRSMERAKIRLIFLDACRDNPVSKRMQEATVTRSLNRGLARVEAVGLGTPTESPTGLGTLISFSTAPGLVALDGSGQNSPFAAALAKHLTTQGLEISQLLRLVRRDVYAMTRGRQVPWDNSALTAEVILWPYSKIALPREAVLRSRAKTTLSRSGDMFTFTAPDGRKVSVGRDVHISEGVNISGSPVLIAP